MSDTLIFILFYISLHVVSWLLWKMLPPWVKTILWIVIIISNIVLLIKLALSSAIGFVAVVFTAAMVWHLWKTFNSDKPI